MFEACDITNRGQDGHRRDQADARQLDQIGHALRPGHDTTHALHLVVDLSDLRIELGERS
jgi:hypothetical protein